MVRLGDLVEVVHGYAFKTRYATDEPSQYALFTRKNVALGGGFREDSPRYYHADFAERFLLVPGDMLLVLTDLSKHGDLLGLPAIVPPADLRYLHNQRMGKVVVRDDRVDTKVPIRFVPVTRVPSARPRHGVTDHGSRHGAFPAARLHVQAAADRGATSNRRNRWGF